MSLTLITEPKTLINISPTYIYSKWNAVCNPIYFKFLRKDLLIASIILDGSDMKVSFTAPLSGSEFEVDDFIYINSGTYDKTYVITYVGADYVLIDGSHYKGNTGAGGYAIYYKDGYRVEFRLFSGVDLDLDQIGSNFYAVNDEQGNIYVDVSTRLRSLIDITNERTGTNYRDEGIGSAFALQYRERVTGDGLTAEDNWSPDPVTSDNIYYWVYAVKQITEPSNMEEFVIQNTPLVLPRFLTAFTEPCYFPGYPFELAFIYSELIFNPSNSNKYVVYKKEQEKDINKINVGGENTYILDHTKTPGVNRIPLSNYAQSFTEVWLETDGTEAEDHYVNVGYHLDGYVQ